MKKQVVILLLILCMFANSLACNSGIKSTKREVIEPTKFVMKVMNEDVMPIVGFYAPSPACAFGDYVQKESLITEEQYQYVEDSGINMLYGLREDFKTTPEEVLKALDLSEKHNIGYIVSDSRLCDIKQRVPVVEDTSFKDLISAYSNKKAFAGFHIVDEPSAELFDDIQKARNAFDFALPGNNMVFGSNLLPSYANGAQLFGKEGYKGRDYQDHVELFLNTVNMDFLSYDYYPLQGKQYELRAKYFYDMFVIRQTAQKHNIPFWTFIQAVGKYEGSTQPRVPTEEEMMWQVNTSLAYGAQGIQYFPYLYPPEWRQTYKPNGAEIYYSDAEGCFIGKDNKPTEIYQYGKRINKHIAAIDEVLMNSYNEGIIYNSSTGTAPVYEGKRATDKPFSLESYYELLGIADGSTEAIVGCFNYKGKSAFYVVNNNIDPGENTGAVTLNFDKKYTFDIIRNATSSNITAKDLTLELGLGEGVLLVIK